MNRNKSKKKRDIQFAPKAPLIVCMSFNNTALFVSLFDWAELTLVEFQLSGRFCAWEERVESKPPRAFLRRSPSKETPESQPSLMRRDWGHCSPRGATGVGLRSPTFGRHVYAQAPPAAEIQNAIRLSAVDRMRRLIIHRARLVEGAASGGRAVSPLVCSWNNSQEVKGGGERREWTTYTLINS